MRITVLVLFVFSIVVEGSAQRLWLMGTDSLVNSSDVLLDLSADAGWRSNSLDNEMMNALLFGGYISNDLSARQFNRMDEVLSIGGSYNAQFRVIFPNDSAFGLGDWGWQGIVQMRGLAEAGADKDLFHLIFDGNAPDYIGTTANFNDTWIDYMEYQKVGFGMWHRPTQSGFTVSVVNGQQFQRMNVFEGEIFTSQDADSLSLLYNGIWLQSDTGVTGFGVGNGIGAALDGRINVPLRENRGFVSVEVEDLGLVHWSKGSMEYEADSLFSYTGIPVADLIDDDGDALPNFEDSLYYTQEQRAMNRWLPGRVRASLLHTLGKKDFFQASMEFRPVRVFDPQLRLGYFYRLRNRALVGATTTVGGYGSWRFGIVLEKWIAERCFLSLNIEDIYGPFAKTGLGTHGNVRFTYRIKKNA